MKNKKLYHILPFGMVGLCILGMCVVGTRIFSKKILIGKLGIENYWTCTLADYNWGDRLERTFSDDSEEEISTELRELSEVLAGAPLENDAANENETEKNNFLENYSEKVFAAEEDINKYCNEKFMGYNVMRKIGSLYDSLLGWNLTYARTMGATYTLKTGFDYQAVEAMSCAEYAEDIIGKKEVAERCGVDFLYVQYPYRVDEENSQVPWGAESNENQNADEVLKLLKADGVDILDLRKELVASGWDYETGFYDTDGHWTTRSGFVSAGIVAEYLNNYYEYNYEEELFRENNYYVNSYSVNNYAVEEKVELFMPNFSTNMRVMDAYRNEEYSGSFPEACFDMSKAETEEYSTVLTAYSASRIRNSYLFEYENLNEVNNQKRILITSDSFSWHLIPYLALDTSYVDYVYKMTEEQMEYYIEKLQPDMVIVMDKPYY